MADGDEILLIEDSETQALRMTVLLEEEGLSVRRTASAEEGLTALETCSPDLIMVDYHLPGMEGDEFCRQIRLNKGVKSVPVVILTDDTEMEVERLGLESGADDHISKAMEPPAMMAKIHALMRHRHKWGELDGRLSEKFKKTRILIVDDSLTFLAFLHGELEQEGYAVTEAQSGEAALEAVNKESFDCIIVDLIMPGVDGIELCTRLDEFRHDAGLSFPLLMVTGKDSNEEMMRALEAGADDFVSKSNDIKIIKARIRTLVRRKFLQEEHERITGEFRNKELEITRERAAREAAQAKAELAEQLKLTNRELKEAQSQLVQSAKMASLGELVAGIAHEINNPLSFVMNHISTVDSRLSGIADEVEPNLSDGGRKKWEKARQRLGDITEGLERVRELVVKLRTFSRLDEGEFKTVDMCENIESTISLVRYRCKERIKITAQHAENSILSCYPGTLNQVVMNVISNAIDAIEGEGEITVTTRRSANEFFISVADTGPGIPAEIKDRIFEPFFTTKAVGEGTGLGLSISYRIVASHKGRLEIGDRPEGGAEVTIVVPTDLNDEEKVS